MNDESIRVLHVDDSPSMLELAAYRLENHAGFDVVSVTDPTEVLSSLSAVDCVVADFEMPELTGLELLSRVRERDAELPFILFTGRGSEEIASEAISAGVTDYLQKGTGSDQFDVLANRIRNAVESYQAREALRSEKRRTERILEVTPVGIVVHNRSGDVLLANDRAQELLGGPEVALDATAYPNADWELRTLDDDRVTADLLPYRRVVDTGSPIYDVDYVLETADGRTVELIVHGTPLVGDSDTVEGAVVTFHPQSWYAASDDETR